MTNVPDDAGAVNTAPPPAEDSSRPAFRRVGLPGPPRAQAAHNPTYKRCYLTEDSRRGGRSATEAPADPAASPRAGKQKQLDPAGVQQDDNTSTEN
jgi:hypothetical protein